MKSPTHIPSKLTWYCWISLIRLLISLAWGLNHTIVLISEPTSFDSSTAFLYPVSFLLISINDILMLTLDLKRTGSYVGTVLAQTITSVLLLVPPVTSIGFGSDPNGPSDLGYIFNDPNDPYGRANFAVNSIHISCTLCLAFLLLLSKRKAGVNALWKSNAKNVLLGSKESRSRLSWFGHSRDPPLQLRNISMFSYFWAIYVPRIMLRRVSPVESKRYAFFQNFCAFLFMVAIIVRAVMAIAQAQNQIETRSGAGSCDNFLFLRNLRVLVRHQRTDAGGANPQTGQGYDVGVQVATRRTGQYQCTSEIQHAALQAGNWFQVFNCQSQSNRYIFFSEATYTITIRSTNGTSLDAVQLPSIWFANFADTYRDTSVSNRQDFMSSVAPWLIPPWEMIGGMHVQGTVSIVERRFITFSVFRDIVPSLKPTYRSASLFTITTTNTAPSPDNFTSSASLRSSQVSTLSYLNSPSGFMASKLKSSSMPPVCAFIEDYRSSTIFDAIGSIGGLLAVLQGAHILLFGRPLFWGLTGAKLITPFGLFGGCHSRGFQRRLRDRYHRQPTAGQAGDAAEAIRIHAFLRDFVIDFGPADVENQVIESGRNMEPERLLRLQFDHDRFREDDEDDTNDT